MDNVEPASTQEKQQSTQDMENNQAVRSAITFLNDPRVKRTPTDRKIRFLKGKGLSSEEIKYAFERSGLPPISLEQIAAVPAPETGTATLSTAPSNTLPSTQPSPYLFPPSPAVAEEPEEAARLDWRDVVIGSGVAALIAGAGYKFFKNFSPYEIRRKDSPRRGGHGEKEEEAEERFAKAKKTPLPPTPAISQIDREELEKVKKELEETKEILNAERKKIADYAVNAAKLRGEKLQVARTNDRLTLEVGELREKLKKYEEAELKEYQKELDHVKGEEEVEEKEEEEGEKEGGGVEAEGNTDDVQIVESFTDLSSKSDDDKKKETVVETEGPKKHVKFADENVETKTSEDKTTGVNADTDVAESTPEPAATTEVEVKGLVNDKEPEGSEVAKVEDVAPVAIDSSKTATKPV